MRVRLKSEREGVEYSSTPRRSLFDRGCASIVLKTIDRTAVIVSTLYWRSALKSLQARRQSQFIELILSESQNTNIE